MTFSELPKQITTREMEKFDLDEDGNVIVRTSARGTFSMSGLSNGGLITHVTLNDTEWKPLPATPLTNRNSILVQNISDNGNIVLWNYSAAAPATQGVRIIDGASKTTDFKNVVIIYGRMLSGTGEVVVDEVG